MKKTLLAAVFALLVPSALFAQGVRVLGIASPDLTGQWQGTLALGQGLRTIITISKDANGGYQGAMYSIDQSPQPIAVGGIVLQGESVKLAIPSIGATYDGRLSSDGGTVVGSVTQAGRTSQLNLTRATKETAWAIPERPAGLKPMAADAKPEFAAATIKTPAPGTQGKGFRIRPGQFETINTSLSDIMTFVYGLHARQIVNGPAWMETEFYNITGKPDGEGQPSPDQWKEMLKKLLADRFKLKFHTEKRELAVYSLVVARTGPKLTKSQGNPDGPGGLIFQGLGKLPAQNSTMTEFANVMQAAVLDRPVVDNTGITGRWDFTLNWTPDESQFRGLGVNVPAPKDDPSAPPDLFTAIQQQAGLRFESTRAPVDVIVIDTVDHPTSD
ncbi:MAG TPA: TIGR03435 family protein [Vicinamibacterales bacterium]|jgi:uncharacterized protein (TIGR03435 family)|nr:TIGR03435 family protein [Vicinamibacterales bacterium]